MEGFLMKANLWCSVSVLASLAVSVGAAGAADLAVKAPVYKAAPVYLSDWAGFYLGVNGGYGFGETSFDGGLTEKPKGGLFGGHAGYNWQYGSIVAGVEVDFDGADIKDSQPSRLVFGRDSIPATTTTKFDELATARARLGYTVLPNLLAYGTAGPGWGHSEVTDTTRFGTASNGATDFGWTAGAGLEYKVWGNFIARAEYLHYDFAKDSNNAKTTVDTVRGGVSYKF
jgi:opacity protein-like surface antigen